MFAAVRPAVNRTRASLGSAARRDNPDRGARMRRELRSHRSPVRAMFASVLRSPPPKSPSLDVAVCVTDAYRVRSKTAGSGADLRICGKRVVHPDDRSGRWLTFFDHGGPPPPAWSPRSFFG